MRNLRSNEELILNVDKMVGHLNRYDFQPISADRRLKGPKGSTFQVRILYRTLRLERGSHGPRTCGTANLHLTRPRQTLVLQVVHPELGRR